MDYFRSFTVYLDSSKSVPPSPAISYHLFSFAHIQVKLRLITPFCEVTESRNHDDPAFPEGEKVKQCHQ